MKAALFFNGSERFPSSLPLGQTILEELAPLECFTSAEFIRMKASHQRGRVSIGVRTVVRQNFSPEHRKNWQLAGRIYGFLSRVETFYRAVEDYKADSGQLLLFDGFKLLLQEAEIYKFSQCSGADLIWLKTAVRTSAEQLVGQTRKLDALIVVSLGGAGARKIVTETIRDSFVNGLPCLWANKVIPFLEDDLVTAALFCASELSVHATSNAQDGRVEHPTPSPA